jgi:WD40 repeat protein
VWDGLDEDPAGGPPPAVYDVAWQPAGDLFAAGTIDGALLVGSVSTPARWTREAHQEQVRSVCWSPDGRQIVTHGEECQLVLWDWEGDPRPLFALRHTPDYAGPVVWSPAGNILVAASGSRALVIEVMSDTLRLVEAIDVGIHLSSLAFAPDGERVVAGTADTALAEIDLLTHHVRMVAGHGEPVSAVAIDRSGRVVSCGHRGELLRWPLGAGAEPERLGHLPTDTVWDLDLSSDGAVLIVAGDQGTALRAQTAAPASATRLKVDSGLTSCSFAPDAGRAVFGGAAGVYVYHAREAPARPA